MRSRKLSSLLNTIDDSVEGQRNVTFADITDALDRRGFGPLLVMPSLITILPTGAIPGVPALSGAVICLIAAQLAWGRDKPWMPDRLRDFSIKRKTLQSALEKAKPVAEAIDEFAHPRYETLTRKGWERVIALICVLLALVMMMIGFIPYVPALLSLPILLFAIGLSVRDGLLAFAGFIFGILVLCALPFIYSLVR